MEFYNSIWKFDLPYGFFYWNAELMKPSIPQSAMRNPFNRILGAEAHVRVLRELFRHGGALGVTRLANDVGMSRPGVRSALAALNRAGVVEELGSGRSILYQIDQRHPLTSALGTLFRVEEERTQAVLDAVKSAVHLPEIMGAWIYGSFARGRDQAGSDLDIAVLTGQRDLSVIERVRATLDSAADKLRFAPSVVGIDLADVDRMSRGDPWWNDLVRDALVIKGGRPETLTPARRETAVG